MKGKTIMKTKEAQKKAMRKYYYTEKGKQTYFRAQLKRRAKIESNPELKKKMIEYATAHRTAYLKTERGREDCIVTITTTLTTSSPICFSPPSPPILVSV